MDPDKTSFTFLSGSSFHEKDATNFFCWERADPYDVFVFLSFVNALFLVRCST